MVQFDHLVAAFLGVIDQKRMGKFVSNISTAEEGFESETYESSASRVISSILSCRALSMVMVISYMQNLI